MTSRQVWLPAFQDFLSHIRIDSKDTDQRELVPYRAQQISIDRICHGLDSDVRTFVFLKARQLGISTIFLAFDLFYLMLNPGLQAALVCDDDGNRDKFRIIIDSMLSSLPKSHRIPVRTHNRANLVFSNKSVLDYLVAGVSTHQKQTRELGTSRAYTYLHATELSKFGNAAAISQLQATLAQAHPLRCFIYESTAKGFNSFWNMWEAAKGDPTQLATFIGWWAKDSGPGAYRIEPSDARFAEYGENSLTDEEQDRRDKVSQLYGYDISIEQIAWYRWFSATRMSDESLMEESYPWTEDEAFIMTGRSFFPLKKLAQDVATHTATPFYAFRYHLGQSFLETNIEQVSHPVDTDLRVWEWPREDGTYAIGVDPAYGRNDWKDRHAIQVLDCYADRCIQVAEFASDSAESHKVAWVLAHLAGMYRDCVINLEVNGPGTSVMQELAHLRQLLSLGALGAESGMEGVFDILGKARWYLYHRPDSMGAGYVYNWKTNADNKYVILDQMRSSYVLEQLTLRSVPCLHEMRGMTQNGISIEAEGKGKDDRPFASALAHKAWIEWIRPGMLSRGDSFDAMKKRAADKKAPPIANTSRIAVMDFFARKESERKVVAEEALWNER
ncbi:MAG TPA: hypothetical protein VKU84_16920 [Stellaceae bacterium]|nr:hypothetical protein [Stellaceae bacterium]